MLQCLYFILTSGVHHVEQFNESYPDAKSTFSSRNRRSVSCEVGTKRVRRSCVIIPTPPPKPTEPSGVVNILVADNLGFDGKFFYPNQTPNYNLTMYESSCIFWDVLNETWRGEGCKVSIKPESVHTCLDINRSACILSTFYTKLIKLHKTIKMGYAVDQA